jgi:predicted metal-dependent phosphoesterase TrpH
MTDSVRTDLHSHSHFSDGNVDVETWVEERARQGLEVVALSDHDIFSGVRRAAALAHERGVTVIPAMETTAFIHFGTPQAEQVHVLAYFPPSFLESGALERTALYRRSQRVLEAWRRFVLGWFDRLTAEQRVLFDTYQALRELPADRFPGLQTMIKAIFDGRGSDRLARPVKDQPEARNALYRSFCAEHVRFWTEDRELFGWTPEEMMEVIRSDGALDVVAHPNRVRDGDRMQRVLDTAAGVEVYTSRHSAPIAQRFLDLATSRGKHWTASTDDHQHRHLGRYAPPPAGTPRRTIDRIFAGS